MIDCIQLHQLKCLRFLWCDGCPQMDTKLIATGTITTGTSLAIFCIKQIPADCAYVMQCNLLGEIKCSRVKCMYVITSRRMVLTTGRLVRQEHSMDWYQCRTELSERFGSHWSNARKHQCFQAFWCLLPLWVLATLRTHHAEKHRLDKTVCHHP